MSDCEWFHWLHWTSLFITNSWSLLKLMSIELVMPSNHLILCHPLLFLPSILPSIRIFSNELALCIRWPEYWRFSLSSSPSNNYSGLINNKKKKIHTANAGGVGSIPHWGTKVHMPHGEPPPPKKKEEKVMVTYLSRYCGKWWPRNNETRWGWRKDQYEWPSFVFHSIMYIWL